MEFLEQAGEELSASVNKHWRDVAQYERYVMPLIVRLQSVDWPTVLALQSARWHLEAINSIQSWKQQYGCYCWIGSFRNSRTGAYRQIQRYPLWAGLYPTRFCPPGGPPVSYGLWFRLADIKSLNWTPEAHAWHSYEYYRGLIWQSIERNDGEERSNLNRRQYLADRLRNSSQRLGKYVRKDYWNASGMFYEVHYELEYNINKALVGTDTPGSLYALRPADLGEVEARLDHFWRCLKEFHDEETAPPAAIAETLAPTAPPAKGTPAADVRRYFPQAATIHGSTATDANALYQLAVWLLHWAERPSGKRYSLPGRLREQMAAHPHAGKFLRACGRLHEALAPLAATEQDTKALLDKEYTAHSRNSLQDVLTWWAGWIRKQTEAQRNPAGAYLAALKRVPIVEEQDNGTPRYSVPPYLLDWDGFLADIAPLRQAFDDALPDLPKGKKRALRQDVGALLSIEPERLKRQQELFDRQEYFPANLPADYPRLRFEVAGQSGGFSHAHQWVSTVFWGGLRALLHYKQMEARDAFEKLNAALGEAIPIPEPPKNSKHLDPPAPNSPRLEAPTALPLDRVLAIPRPTLDQLLLDAVMIEPAAEPGRYKARPGVKPWQWANVRAALREKLLLAEINDADAAQLFTETYGAIVKRSTMQHRPQAEQNSKNKTRRVLAYAEFLERLPNPKSQ